MYITSSKLRGDQKALKEAQSGVPLVSRLDGGDATAGALPVEMAEDLASMKLGVQVGEQEFEAHRVN